MDVEGAEYDVIDDLLASDLDVRQLLIEFHHQFSGIERTRRAIEALNEAGYRIFDVSAGGKDYAFIRR